MITYADLAAEAAREARRRGLTVRAAEHDESLFLTFSRSGVEAGGVREAVRCWTPGTGAFLVDLDRRWSWQLMAYEPDEQVEAIRAVADLAARYLGGEGTEAGGKLELSGLRFAARRSAAGPW